jgi:hypothetical protein
MAAKKKTNKKAARSKKITRKRMTPAKKQARKGRTPKQSVKSASAWNKTAARKKGSKREVGGGVPSVNAKKTWNRIPVRRASAFSRESAGSGSGGQSGDLQGLSTAERAASESVDELIEEGNAFDAGIVSGVEEAGESGGREVRTREVPEDDVPGEYLNED